MYLKHHIHKKLRQKDHVNRGDRGQLGQANEVVPAHIQSKTGHVFLYFFFVQMIVFFQICYQCPARGVCVKISEAVAPSAKATTVPLSGCSKVTIHRVTRTNSLRGSRHEDFYHPGELTEDHRLSTLPIYKNQQRNLKRVRGKTAHQTRSLRL